MALPATHIRFALDLYDKLGVKERGTYIAGTLYPDSRYITKIDRSVTHDANILSVLRDKTSDDFKKGWAVHLMCDLLQDEERVKHLSAFLPEVGTADWVSSITAMKIIADMNDVQHVNVPLELRNLEIKTPNGEPCELIEEYHRLNSLTYHCVGVPTMDDYRSFWGGLTASYYDKTLLDDIFTKVKDL